MSKNQFLDSKKAFGQQKSEFLAVLEQYVA
jgi:hypothetical protein